MPAYDRINPEDHFWMGLSRSPELEHMPGSLHCPSGHRAYRQLIELVDPEYGSVRVPIYGCVRCQIFYRFQECTLPPGEEGLPPAEESPA